MQFSGIKHIHLVVHPSPLSISKTFSSSRSETLHPLNSNSHYPLETTTLLSVSLSLTTLGSSHKWNHTVIVLFYLDFLTSRRLHGLQSLVDTILPPQSIFSRNLSSPGLSKNSLSHNSSMRKVLKMHTGMTQVTTMANLIQLICLTRYSDFQNKDHNPPFQLYLTNLERNPGHLNQQINTCF